MIIIRTLYIHGTDNNYFLCRFFSSYLHWSWHCLCFLDPLSAPRLFSSLCLSTPCFKLLPLLTLKRQTLWTLHTFRQYTATISPSLTLSSSGRHHHPRTHSAAPPHSFIFPRHAAVGVFVCIMPWLSRVEPHAAAATVAISFAATHALIIVPLPWATLRSAVPWR